MKMTIKRVFLAYIGKIKGISTLPFAFLHFAVKFIVARCVDVVDACEDVECVVDFQQNIKNHFLERSDCFFKFANSSSKILF